MKVLIYLRPNHAQLQSFLLLLEVLDNPKFYGEILTNSRRRKHRFLLGNYEPIESDYGRVVTRNQLAAV